MLAHLMCRYRIMPSKRVPIKEADEVRAHAFQARTLTLNAIDAIAQGQPSNPPRKPKQWIQMHEATRPVILEPVTTHWPSRYISRFPSESCPLGEPPGFSVGEIARNLSNSKHHLQLAIFPSDHWPGFLSSSRSMCAASGWLLPPSWCHLSLFVDLCLAGGIRVVRLGSWLVVSIRLDPFC